MNQDSEKKEVIQLLQSGWLKPTLLKELQGNEDVEEAAPEKNGEELEFTRAALNKDEKVKQVLQRYGHDKDIMLLAVKDIDIALSYASAALKADIEVVRAAVEQNGHALKHASAALKADKTVVLAAVNKNGDALKHASAELKADEEVVRAAVTQNYIALKYASDNLKKDRDFMLAALGKNADVLKDAFDHLKKDRDFMLAALEINGDVLEYASEELLQNIKFLLEVAKRNKKALVHVAKKLGISEDNVLVELRRRHRVQEQFQLASFGFFGGASAMAATLTCSSTAYALVTGLIVFLPHVAAIALAIIVCGLAIALLALGVHAAISNGSAPNSAGSLEPTM